MAQLLKVSTAFTFRLGPFVDAGDGVTAETSLTLSQGDFRLSKAGGAFAQKNETTAGTHDENGYYTCILNTTDTNTLGTLDINVSESGALPVFKSFMVVPAIVYDSLVAGTDLLDVSTTQFNGSAVTASSGRPEVNTTHAAGTAWASGAIVSGAFASGAITAGAIATDAIGSDELAASAITEIQSGLATAAALATVDGIVDDILVDTAEIGAAGAGLTALASAANLATVAGYIDTEIGALTTAVADLPTNAELATALGTADDAVLTAIDALPTANENADALLDRANAIETGLTPRQALRLSAAADGGKLSGGATTTNTIRNAVADDKDRIIATVDADGNRTAITYDLT